MLGKLPAGDWHFSLHVLENFRNKKFSSKTKRREDKRKFHAYKIFFLGFFLCFAMRRKKRKRKKRKEKNIFKNQKHKNSVVFHYHKEKKKEGKRKIIIFDSLQNHNIERQSLNNFKVIIK